MLDTQRLALTYSHQKRLPSALKSLTTEFGMGSGVPSSLETLDVLHPTQN